MFVPLGWGTEVIAMTENQKKCPPGKKYVSGKGCVEAKELKNPESIPEVHPLNIAKKKKGMGK